MTDCIFCKIIKGEIPSSKVYEDETTYAFLDIAPINKGHTLVIPKQHHEKFMETDDAVLADIITKVKRIATTIKEATQADGINIGINNEKAAGQVVFHTHFHIIPRFEGDGLKTWPDKKYDEGEMESYKEKIVKLL